MTHTAPPSASHHQQPSQHFCVQRDVYLLVFFSLLHNLIFAGHQIKLGCTHIASSSLRLLVNNMFWGFLFVVFVFYKVCHKCHAVFQDNDTKHHCRACGEGFCDGCSSKAAPVPERGWGLAPVRVCDVCFEQRASHAGTHLMSNVALCECHLTFG